MLLVSFHGGPGAQNNLAAYDTTTPSPEPLTTAALQVPPGGALAELRAMVVRGGQLYVANGAKSTSQVLRYGLPDAGGHCAFLSIVVGPTLSNKGHFETSIAHPFGIAFDGASCFVSNQDTNVVALVAMGGDGPVLGAGSRSAYLNATFPQPPALFLDGTFVASQQGDLDHVNVKATDVPAAMGGLGVSPSAPGSAPKNSVRGVAVANGLLFVCNEVGSTVNVYASADGTFLGASNPIPTKPTHVVVWSGGLFVVAGASLWWAPLPSVSEPAIALQAIAVPGQPAGNTLGGISFDGATAYVPFQTGTGGSTPGGSITTYTVTQGSQAPALSSPQAFVTALPDTPELVLFV
jgi:hypothetical protein